MINNVDEILKYENIVYSIINKYTYYFDSDDLYQVGMIGLINAFNNYQDDKNTKFSSYAYFYVLGTVKEYIRNTNMMKVSKELVKINTKVEKAREVLTQRLGKVPDDDDIALFLEIDVNLVREASEANSMIESIENDEGLSILNTFGYTEDYYRDDIQDLKNEIEKLSSYEQDIIYKRYTEGLTQSQVSKELGINQVKVSRTEKEILTKLRTRLM